MGYLDDSSILDPNLVKVRDDADKLVMCAGQPTNYNEAQTDKGVGNGKRLGEVTIAPGDWGAVADDGAGGRKITKNAEGSVAVSVSGAADHIAYVDTVEEVLLHARPLGATSNVTAGQVGTIPAHDFIEALTTEPA